jgi:hypothetical protein
MMNIGRGKLRAGSPVFHHKPVPVASAPAFQFIHTLADEMNAQAPDRLFFQGQRVLRMLAGSDEDDKECLNGKLAQIDETIHFTLAYSHILFIIAPSSCE